MTALLTRPADALISDTLLSARLRSIGITPIDGIEEYMAQELAAAPPSTMLGRFFHRREWSSRPFDWALTVAIVSLVGMGLLLPAAGVVALGFLPVQYCLVIGATGIALLLLGIGLEKATRTIFLIARGPAYWETKSVWPRDSCLPGFAQKRMRAVLKDIPGATFEMADLQQNRYSLDPVLFVISEGEREAIAVWKYDKEVILI